MVGGELRDRLVQLPSDGFTCPKAACAAGALERGLLGAMRHRASTGMTPALKASFSLLKLNASPASDKSNAKEGPSGSPYDSDTSVPRGDI